MGESTGRNVGETDTGTKCRQSRKQAHLVQFAKCGGRGASQPGSYCRRSIVAPQVC